MFVPSRRYLKNSSPLLHPALYVFNFQSPGGLKRPGGIAASSLSILAIIGVIIVSLGSFFRSRNPSRAVSDQPRADQMSVNVVKTVCTCISRSIRSDVLIERRLIFWRGSPQEYSASDKLASASMIFYMFLHKVCLFWR